MLPDKANTYFPKVLGGCFKVVSLRKQTNFELLCSSRQPPAKIRRFPGHVGSENLEFHYVGFEIH